jgi:hypothetical protein
VLNTSAFKEYGVLTSQQAFLWHTCLCIVLGPWTHHQQLGDDSSVHEEFCVCVLPIRALFPTPLSIERDVLLVDAIYADWM